MGYMDTFSERLKACRIKKKDTNSLWTQSYAADQIGVARTTYTAYENGTKTPPLETVNIIADLFEVTTDYLLGRTDSSETTPQNKCMNENQSILNNPDLLAWYRELPKHTETDLLKLKIIWEIIKNEQN